MARDITVHRLKPDELETVISQVESAVDATPEIDPWCSSPDWVLGVHTGFAPESEQLIWQVNSPSGAGFALLARYELEVDGPLIGGLEPLWGFACPLVGADLDLVAHAVGTWLSSEADWTMLVLGGMPMPTGPDSTLPRIIRGLGPNLGKVQITEGLSRRVTSLAGGYERWLAERSPRFRKSLAKAKASAEEAGLTFCDASNDPDAFGRLMAVEATSWKGLDDDGLMSPSMSKTYSTIVNRLKPNGRLRLWMAQIEDEDVGYILGGVRARRYRGLQLSYSADWPKLSIGHLLQLHQIKMLCNHNEADIYDLGMDMEYKQRWADRLEPSLTLVIDRR